MDEPAEWAKLWPYWKFGLKQNDLHDSLHTRYNTISWAIQDPEAFHHDVYELSVRASSLSEFECLMEERKNLRLEELDTMLEDASFQIVGCPKLIGTSQWPLAVQLFRTKSFDSLVRYFASYLPYDHPLHRDSDSGINSGDSDVASPRSPIHYADYDGPLLFDEPEDDETLYTHDPSESFSTCGTAVDLADQPARSNTLHSVDSGVSVTERKQRKGDHDSRCPSRTRFDSESEPDVTRLRESIPTLHVDEDSSPSEDSETRAPYDSHPSESLEGLSDRDVVVATIVDDEDGFLPISRADPEAMDTTDSDAATPKAVSTVSPATPATPLFDASFSPLRTPSANRSHPHHAYHISLNHQQSRNIASTRQPRCRDGSLEPERSKRSQGGRAGRRRDESPDGVRSRTRARRRRPGF
ncbi:unnamed protein product [Discula destructiva]